MGREDDGYVRNKRSGAQLKELAFSMQQQQADRQTANINFSFVQDGIYALGKAHKRSIQSVKLLALKRFIISSKVDIKIRVS